MPPADTTRDQVRTATSKMVRAAMELVEAHYRGHDIEEHLAALEREARELPRNITPSSDDRSDLVGLAAIAAEASAEAQVRELVAAIAAEATAEARRFASKKSWKTALKHMALELPESKYLRICEILYEEWTRTAEEEKKAKKVDPVAPPQRKDVIEHVADKFKLEPETVKRVWNRWRAEQKRVRGGQ